MYLPISGKIAVRLKLIKFFITKKTLYDRAVFLIMFKLATIYYVLFKK